MIRYAITAGNHLPFPNRKPETAPCADTGFASGCPECSAEPVDPLPSTSLLDQARHLARQGVDYIQLREKHLPAGELAELARLILDLLSRAASENPTRTRLLINSRADVAAATGAHGVHLAAAPGGLTPRQVHSLYRSIGLSVPVVSKSCHTLPEIRTARLQQPDLILFSPVFGKYVDGLPVAPAVGFQALESACALAYPIPVLALGGVTSRNTPSCLNAGAAGVAGIRLFQP